MAHEELLEAVCASIEKNAPLICGVSEYIWDNPELSLQEFKAAKRYAEVLREAGFAVTEGVCGIETAVLGSYGHGRPLIGILGEYDALDSLSQEACSAARRSVVPGGAGHGCGHNLLGAGSLAAALAVKEYLEQSGREGTVLFCGCPGEEGGAAKAFMAREGFWKKLDAALCWHPGDRNEVKSGVNNSCIQVLYRFTGIASHAAGNPEAGRSALDAVELMNLGVQFLREHMPSECRIHYAITNAGGLSPNVVQPEAEVLYMVRGVKVQQSLELLARVDKIAEGAALMTETSLSRRFIDGTSELLPNFTLEKLLHECMTELGAPQFSQDELALASALRKTYASGAEGAALSSELEPLDSNERFTPGSTDVGDVSYQTPAAQVYTACFPLDAPGHSWQNVSFGRSSGAERAMLFAGKIMALAALRLFSEEELLASAREEFHARTEKQGYVCPIPADAVPTAI